MIIHAPRIHNDNNRAIATFDIESDLEAKSLWFSLDIQYRDFLSERCDAALIALLMPAMAPTMADSSRI